MGFLLTLHKDTSYQPLDNPVFIHLLADYSAHSPEQTIYNALLLHNFKGATLINSNQDFKFGEIISPGIFLKLVHTDFPMGTIHICMLHIEHKHKEKYLLAEHNGQFYFAPDNGVLSIAFGLDDVVYYELPDPVPTDDIFKSIYLPGFQKLVEGQLVPSGIFPQYETAKRSIAPAPTLNGNILRLTVLFNDSYGNAYLNISKEEFERVTSGKKYAIRLGFKDNIEKFSPGYSSVPEGQKLALFGLGYLLQIAINAGSAAQYLALEKGKIVMVEIQ